MVKIWYTNFIIAAGGNFAGVRAHTLTTTQGHEIFAPERHTIMHKFARHAAVPTNKDNLLNLKSFCPCCANLHAIADPDELRMMKVPFIQLHSGRWTFFRPTLCTSNSSAAERRLQSCLSFKNPEYYINSGFQSCLQLPKLTQVFFRNQN